MQASKKRANNDAQFSTLFEPTSCRGGGGAEAGVGQEERGRGEGEGEAVGSAEVED